MKTAGMLFNCKNDSCWILGRYIKLQWRIFGHDSLPMTDMIFENMPKIELHYVSLEKCSRMEKRRKT